MSIELSAVRMWRVSWRFFKSVAVFLAGALAIAAAAGALGGVVAGIVVVVLGGPTPVQGRILDRTGFDSDFVVTDDLARLCEGNLIERNEISGSNVIGVSRIARRKDGAVLAGLGLPKEIGDRWKRDRERERPQTGIEEAIYEDVCKPRRSSALECGEERSYVRLTFENGIDRRARRLLLLDAVWPAGK